MNLLRLIGWDKETNRPIWKNIYYNFSWVIILMLGYEALFVHPIGWDRWGMTSPYITKLLIIMIIFFIIWHWWGHSQLSSRVNELEDRMVKGGRLR